jgi:formylglycine-generating enzyme required for sulfatase activity
MNRRVMLKLPVAAALMGQRFDGVKAGEQREIAGLRFCWCPSGNFRMGSPLSEPDRRADEGQVSVTLSRGFWTGKYEVTQRQWTAVVGSFPKEQDKGEGDDFPVHWVSYIEAEDFCRRLTERARASSDLPRDWAVRLPTEAQWEYACRAGSTTTTSFGDRLTPAHANFKESSIGRASKAGSYPANGWGLHDMHGNEWEWCRDWYHRQLPGGVDPDLSATQGERNRDGTYSRVRRGGAWIEDGWACRSAMRLRYEPERRSDHIGFRVVAVRQ